MNNLLNLLLLSSAARSCGPKSRHQINNCRSASTRNTPSNPPTKQPILNGAHPTSSHTATHSTNADNNISYSNNNASYSANNSTTNNTSYLATNAASNNQANTNKGANGAYVAPKSPLYTSDEELLDLLYKTDTSSDMPPTTGPFSLPPLEYAYNALEPYIDEETLRLHHNKHHCTYVTNLNEALAQHPEFYNFTLEELLLFSDRLPSDIQTQVINNGGGHYNHTLMWKMIGPPTGSKPSGAFGKAVDKQFGSFDNLKAVLKNAALSVFGSGYAYLALNPYGRLQVVTLPNQMTPIPLRMIPLLPIDVWEHAYYLKNQNRRENYIDNYFNVINWDRVGARYDKAMENLDPNLFQPYIPS